MSKKSFRHADELFDLTRKGTLTVPFHTIPPNPSAERFIDSLGIAPSPRQEPPQAAAPLRDAPAGAVRRPICDGALKERKQNAAHMGGILISPADKSALGELGKWPKRRRRRKKRGHFKAAAPLAGSAEPRKWVCRNAGQARRAALRPYFLRTRGQARGLPSGPPGNFTCSAEVNSACAKVLGPRPKTLVRRKAPPHLRWGPEGAQAKCRPYGRHFDKSGR